MAEASTAGRLGIVREDGGYRIYRLQPDPGSAPDRLGRPRRAFGPVDGLSEEEAAWLAEKIQEGLNFGEAVEHLTEAVLEAPGA